MNIEQTMNWVVNYGLGITLAMLISFGAWYLLIYILKENTKREDRLASIIENYLGQTADGLQKLTESIAARDVYYSDLKEANKLQRQEHKEIVDKLLELGKILQSMENRVEFTDGRKK